VGKLIYSVVTSLAGYTKATDGDLGTTTWTARSWAQTVLERPSRPGEWRADRPAGWLPSLNGVDDHGGHHTPSPAAAGSGACHC
jgi:hypothetical protein